MKWFRKTGTVAFWLVAVLLVLAAGCGRRATPSPAAPGGEESDPNVPIEVQVGQEFAITLGSNPTTGYRWQLAEPLDESRLKLVGSEYKAPETERVGAGGREVWTFKAVGAGKTSIALRYVRPWEKDVPPAETRTFVIVVR